MNVKRFQEDFKKINNYGKTDQGINRLCYTPDWNDSLEFLKKTCISEGMEVRVDAVGNMIARREGKDPTLPAVVCGSHIDTVYNGGAYDGTMGVIGGLEAIRCLNDANIQTMHPIELIAFACEECSRFGLSSIGSKAITGALEEESLMKLKDKDGISLQKAFTDNQLDFKSINKAKKTGDKFKAFLELHVEQGPYLEDENFEIGVVTGIAAPTRLNIQVEGLASHSGATNMTSRKDALLGAAELALFLEEAAKKEVDNQTVATVGYLVIKPGAINVVPGYVEMQVDIRSLSRDSKERVFNQMLEKINIVKEKRGLDIAWDIICNEEPVFMDSKIQKKLIRYCEELNFSYTLMPSGAGHDAMNMAKICPAGMIFVPSKGGISHNPEENTSIEDIERGVILLKNILIDLAIPLD